MIKTYIFIALFILQNTFCQEKVVSNKNTEKVFVHLNSTSLVTGDFLLYNAYCLNEKGISNLSKNIYIELVDNKNTIVFKHKLILKDGNKSGQFFINPNLKTGQYKLIAYTKWMQNFDESSYFFKEILIVNPFEKINLENELFQINQTDTIHKILSNETKIKKRTKVNLTDFIKDSLNGNLSISIRKKNNITFDKVPEINQIEKKNITNTTAKITQKLEFRGEIISGYITSTNQSVENKSIALTQDNESPYLIVVQTNKSGHFSFDITEHLNTKNIIVQVFEKNKDDFTLHFDKEIEINYNSFKLNENVILKQDYSTEIEKNAIYSQIENAYYESKKDSLITTKNASFINPKLFNIYKLDNFTRFPTLKETIIEIIDELYFNEKKGDFSIHLRSFDDLYNPDDEPLLMVDGILIQDPNELLQLKATEIDEIKIINKRYFFSAKYFGGVVLISTKEKKFKPTKNEGINLDFITPNADIERYNPEYNSSTKLERIPDYRTQLLWLNDVRFINKNYPKSFYTSDVEGVFEIIIQGVLNNGNYFYFNDEFEVIE